MNKQISDLCHLLISTAS